MASASNIIFYILTFLSVYVQVFFLITFFEKKNKILVRKGTIELDEYPAVTVIVPCYNEAQTIRGTIGSLLDLDYPIDQFLCYSYSISIFYKNNFLNLSIINSLSI